MSDFASFFPSSFQEGSKSRRKIEIRNYLYLHQEGKKEGGSTRARARPLSVWGLSSFLNSREKLLFDPLDRFVPKPLFSFLDGAHSQARFVVPQRLP